MSTKTKNINLVLQDDGDEKWGDVLNQNFNIIDTKIEDSVTVATKQFFNAGLYKAVDKTNFFITADGSTLHLPIFECFFPSEDINFIGTELPNTVTIAATDIKSNDSKIVEAFSQDSDEYKIFYFGITKNLSSYTINIFTDSNYFKEHISSSIYLGNFIIYKIEDASKPTGFNYLFAKNLEIIKPWFSNFSSNDRIIDIATHGTLTGGYIINNGTKLKPTDNFTWVHEGINCSDSFSPHFINNIVKTNSQRNIQFFRAYNNKKYSEEELELNTDLDGTKYLNNQNVSNVGTSQYTIQRYCILENGYSVVFYGNKIYNSKEEAKSDMALIGDISSIVLVKEVARIIINGGNNDIEIINLDDVVKGSNLSYFNDKYFTIYNKDGNGTIKFNAENNSTQLSTNILKQNYIIADAADTYSNGIIPNSNNSFILNNNKIEYNKFNSIIVKNNLNENSLITKYEIPNGEYTLPSLLVEGWYKLIWNYNNGFNVNSIETSLNDSEVLIGFIYYDAAEEKYQSLIVAPYIALTNPSARTDFKYSKVNINGLYPYVTNNKIGLNLGTIKSEGINYNNNSNYNLKSIPSNESLNIQWYYISNTGKLLENEMVDTITLPTSGWNIQKLLVGSNGEYFVSKNNNTYSSKEQAIANLQSENELLNINNNIMLEIARIVISSSGSNEVYYTNQKILGSLNLTVIDPSQIPTDFDIADFAIYQSGDKDKNIKFENVDNSSVTLKVYNNGVGIGNLRVQLDNLSSKNNYFLQYKNGTEGEEGHFELSPVDFSSIEQRLYAIENKLNDPSKGWDNVMHYYNGEAPDIGNDGEVYLTLIPGTNKKYIKFWNGSSWEILNTWQ